jgi:hypothetical protein
MSRRRRPPRIVVADPFDPPWDPFNFLPKPPPPSDDQLRAATYRQVLKWCANRQGILQRDRLLRVAKARKHHPKWVDRLAGRPLADALADVTAWQREQQVD